MLLEIKSTHEFTPHDMIASEWLNKYCVVVVLPFQQQPVLVDLATIKSISNSICCYYGIYIVAPGINHLTPRVEPNEKDGHTSQATCNLIGPCSYKV